MTSTTTSVADPAWRSTRAWASTALTATVWPGPDRSRLDVPGRATPAS